MVAFFPLRGALNNITKVSCNNGDDDDDSDNNRNKKTVIFSSFSRKLTRLLFPHFFIATFFSLLLTLPTQCHSIHSE